MIPARRHRAVAMAMPVVLVLAVVRGIAVQETPGDEYKICSTDSYLTTFKTTIQTEYNDCLADTKFVEWDQGLPSTADRKKLCACEPLIAKLQAVPVPHCWTYMSSLENPSLEKYTYKKVVEYAFELCDTSNITAASTTTPVATTTTPTTTRPLQTTAGRPENDLPTAPTFTSTAPSATKAPALGVDTSTSSDSKSSNTGLIVGLVVALVVVTAIAAFAIYKLRKKNKRKPDGGNDGDGVLSTTYAKIPSPSAPTLGRSHRSDQPHATQTRSRDAQATPGTTASSDGKGSSVPGARTVGNTEMAMWDDPVLLALRVPYDSVFFGPLLSQGGFGEVYKGTYRGETVAIKQLLPHRRKDLTQIDAFLSEVKLMSTLEHERIIKFLGVAWHALSDACVIVEYMANGDLRSVLTGWDREQARPQGFDADKIKIALHVAHALTYLHSLQPMVVHRDLKSKNILINGQYDAKLSDFGVSRARGNSTMTAGVGSSLWMAPEVMLGERYDEKADVFSFGIVLSELDTLRFPYDHAKETGTDYKLAEPAILQMISLGKLHVAFSEFADFDLVQLGRDCVQLDPSKRPTAPQVLHRIHTALNGFRDAA